MRSVAAVGVSVFGDHEDVANARIEFEDGSVANVTASRASYQAVRKMRIWGAEGYASLDFAAKQATLVRPSEQLRRGRLDLDGLDLSQPAAIKEHVFGKILRVDQVECERASRWPWSSRTSSRRHGASPALESAARTPLRHPAGRPGPPEPRSPPMGRRGRDTRGASAAGRTGSALQGPHAWRIKSLRHASDTSGH